MTEWRECKLSDIADIQTGPFGSQLHQSDYVEIGTPIVTVEHLGNKRLKTQNLPMVSEQDKKRLLKYVLKTGDIVFSRVGSVDRCSYVSANENDWLFSGRCLRVRTNKDVFSEFLYYYFCMESTREHIRKIAVGATMPSINTSIMEELNVVLPPLPEQKAIAEVLSSLDDKIDLLTRQNKTLEDLAQAYYRKWFIEDASDEWEEKGLDEIADFLNGLPLQKFPYKSGKPLYVIKIKELNNGFSDNSDLCSFDVPEQYIVNPGDVIFSWSGSLMVDIWRFGKGALNQHLFKVTSRYYPKWFYYFWIKHYLPEFKMIAESKATTMGHIQRHDLSNAVVLVPDRQQLNFMDNIMSPLINKVELNNAQMLVLQKLRDTLLPKLISGEIRVKM